MNAVFKRMIKEICDEENIKYRFISKDFITVLEKDNKINYLFGYKIGLNNHSLGEICDDKYALYDLLNTLNLPVIKYFIVYNKNNNNDYAKECNSYEYVHDFFRKNNNNIVIKPNHGTCGIDVCHITNEEEIDPILDKLFKSNFSISMCPYYDIENEYRMIILNDKVMLKYAKYKPVVMGNGQKTIRELLYDFNKPYFKDKLDDKKYDKVLKQGEIFEYNWKFNL